MRAAISTSNSIHDQRRLVANCSAAWDYPNNWTQRMALEQSRALMEKPPSQFLSYILSYQTEIGCDQAMRQTCSSLNDITIQVKLTVTEAWFYTTSFMDLPDRLRTFANVARSMLFVADFLFVTPLCLLSNCISAWPWFSSGGYSRWVNIYPLSSSCAQRNLTPFSCPLRAFFHINKYVKLMFIRQLKGLCVISRERLN